MRAADARRLGLAVCGQCSGWALFLNEPVLDGSQRGDVLLRQEELRALEADLQRLQQLLERKE